MINKKNYFFLLGSIVNTSFISFAFVSFSILLVLSIYQNNVVGIITCSCSVGLSLIICFIFLFFDGWAFWIFDGHSIKVKKILNRVKKINVSEILSIEESYFSSVFILTGAENELGYLLLSDKQKIIIPYGRYSKEIVNMIAIKNNIEIRKLNMFETGN